MPCIPQSMLREETTDSMKKKKKNIRELNPKPVHWRVKWAIQTPKECMRNVWMHQQLEKKKNS